MKRVLYPAAAVLAFGSASNLMGQTVFTANFETDQSASFTVKVQSSDNDANANFNYDSMTFVQQVPGTSPQRVGIGVAPSSPTSTSKVLRLNANVANASTADTDAISAYPNLTGALPSNWMMTFDVWQNYNGGPAGGTGSTNMIIFGATSTATPTGGPVAATSPSVAADGFYFAWSGEGGAAADYRFYSGTGTIAQTSDKAVWWDQPAVASGGGTEAFNSNWAQFFPSPAFETVGAMGKAWITIRLAVVNSIARVYVKRVGDTAFTEVGHSIVNVPATANRPFVGFSDINTGQSSPAAALSDQFALYDNISVAAANTAAKDWSLFQ